MMEEIVDTTPVDARVSKTNYRVNTVRRYVCSLCVCLVEFSCA